MKFTTISQITAHQFSGNFLQDSEAFDAISDFVKDTNSIADSSAAIRHMYKEGMGLEGEEACDNLTDEELLADFYAQDDSDEPALAVNPQP